MSVPEKVPAEVVSEGDYLDALADRIHKEFERGRNAMDDVVEAYFAIGRCLLEARQALPSDNAYGEWLRAQEFPFTRQWANVLRRAADHEPQVRDAVESQLSTGRAPNVEKAVKQVTAAVGAGRAGRPDLGVIDGGQSATGESVPDLFSTIVIDPPWRYTNVATRGAAEDHYPTMTLDDLAELDLPAADNAHLYLWTTNGFLREAFDLVEVWGFTYKTCLTWCKPQIGMGNWFRNSTEHVLFGVRGRCPTLRNDVPTHFLADRRKHSAKPDSFYDLVESCSPGPRLEMFARRRRMGWHAWGNEA